MKISYKTTNREEHMEILMFSEKDKIIRHENIVRLKKITH